MDDYFKWSDPCHCTKCGVTMKENGQFTCWSCIREAKRCIREAKVQRGVVGPIFGPLGWHSDE